MTAMAQVEVLRAACCIAGADGSVDEGERKLLVELADKVGVGKASLDAMILRAETESDFFQAQFKVLKTEPEATMRILFQVATQDRKLDPEEIEMLKHFATRLDMDAESFRSIAGPVIAKIQGAE